MQENNYSDNEPMSDEEIDETLDESFPASDPPSWTLGTNHRTKKSGTENTENNDGISDSGENQRRLMGKFTLGEN